jgi:peptidyl-prolyl cis-trans isomerase B (cyclophilin B)
MRRVEAHSASQDTNSLNSQSSANLNKSRRSTLLTSIAATLPLLTLSQTSASVAADLSASSTTEQIQLDAITGRVFLDFGLCPEGVRSDRRLGDKSILCSDPEPLGRIVIGLYGNAAPGTVSNFKTLVTSQVLHGTLLSKIIPGQWLVAGTQGPRRSGLLQPPAEITRNPDLLSSTAFKLDHRRPGTVSLNLSENEDDDSIKFSGSYRPLSFLITTGPAPAQALDGENIVFGVIVEGLDVISAITRVPTFQPPRGNGKSFNDFAKFIGDERASKTSAKWGKPLKAVLITNSGVL